VKVFGATLAPLPQLSGWTRLVTLAVSVLVGYGLIRFDPHGLVPDSPAGWLILVLALVAISLFVHAYNLRARLDWLGGFHWTVLSATGELRPELHHNEGTTHNNILMSVEFEVRNGANETLTLCQPSITVVRKTRFRRSIPLVLQSSRSYWGNAYGAHIDDFILPARSRTIVRAGIYGTATREVFSSLESDRLALEVVLDPVGFDAQRIQMLPSVSDHRVR
jgi:hypothetical protein